jgi:hypothetical protein
MWFRTNAIARVVHVSDDGQEVRHGVNGLVDDDVPVGVRIV